MHQQVSSYSRVSSVVINKYSVSMVPIHFTLTIAKPRAGLVLCTVVVWWSRLVVMYGFYSFLSCPVSSFLFSLHACIHAE